MEVYFSDRVDGKTWRKWDKLESSPHGTHIYQLVTVYVFEVIAPLSYLWIRGRKMNERQKIKKSEKEKEEEAVYEMCNFK